MWQVMENRNGRQLESSEKKVVGEPDEGKPHVRFDVAGNGNQEKLIKSQAPFPDPTTGRSASGVAPVSPTVGQLSPETKTNCYAIRK